MATIAPNASVSAPQKVGKGKGRAKLDAGDDEDSSDPKTTTTLYLTGLPPSLTSAALLTQASTIGPVRSAFVVTDKATSTSRGFGYVRFVLREDAEKAVEDGLGEVDGYKVGVKWAKRRLAPEERVKKGGEEREETRPKKEKREVPRVPKDFKANRTVVLQGLPVPKGGEEQEDAMDVEKDEGSSVGPVTAKALYKKARKLGSVEDIVYPAPSYLLSSSASTSSSANIVFADPNTANLVLPKLHAHIFKGHFVTAGIKSRFDALTRLGHAHGGRLIVRNLDFDVSELDLRWAFAPFGSMHSIDVPTSPPTEAGKPARGRGFAFVWFVAEADAAKAIAGMNGSRLYAGIATEKIKGEGSGLKKSEKRKQAAAVAANEKKEEKGRVMAVDWALSKKAFEKAEEPAGQVNDEKEEDEETTDDDGDEEEADSPVQLDGADSSALDEEEDEDEEDVSEEDEDDQTSEEGSEGEEEGASDEEEEEEAKAGPSGASTDDTTIFVRNLAFDVTEDQLYNMFKSFGPLRYARVVMDHHSKRSKGTGFVCFWKKQDARALLKLGEQVEAEGTGKGPLAANGLPSLLQPDPSSGLAARLSLHGRVLGVSPAVSKEKADKLREDRDKEGKGKDKRNLYLMREGVVFANSYEARGLHPTDLATRQESFDQRKALLRTNPSLYISKTRLSIRQIPLFVTDKMLKALARHALAEWRKQVKRGARNELTSEDLGGDTEKSSDRSNEKAGHVKQAKVLRQADRVDAVSGLGKSKGYGFLELVSHADALRVLRWANANPTVPALLRQWSLDDLQASIRKLEAGEEKGGEQAATRLKKLKERLTEVEAEVAVDKQTAQKRAASAKRPEVEKKPARMLIIEFSIENAQTVQRRREKTEKSRDRARRAREQDDANEGKATGPVGKRKRGPDSEQAPASKRPKKDSTETAAAAKQGASIGSLIGRKRRQKKAARGGGK